MPRRIDVELTSVRDDGSWTWRAAGAKQPKGVLDGALLQSGAKVGDVVRAEAEFEIEGITIVSVLAQKETKRQEPERLEIIGSGRDTPTVTTQMSGRPGGRGDRDRDRGDRGDRPRRDRRDRDGSGSATKDWRARASKPSEERPARERGRGDRPDRGPRRERTEGGERREPRREGQEARERRPQRERTPRPERPERQAAPKPKRLAPANTHRNAVIAALPPEQQPIAEQLARGGIPAVRRAIDEQNAQLKAAGQQEIRGEELLKIAEDVLPSLKAAEWRDRAEAAVKDIDEIALRDLRSVVSSSDVARDDESRELAKTLREALERRVNEQREKWLKELTEGIDEGRLVRALRVAARPPDPSTRFPAELAAKLSEAAGAAMSSDTPVDRWAALLEAVAASPVRRSVKPAALPAEAPEALLQAAKQAAGRVPALAPLLGIDMPPPPGPMRPIPPQGRRPARPPQGPKPIPPKPTAPQAAAAAPVEPTDTAESAEPTEPSTNEAPAPEAVVEEVTEVGSEPAAPPADDIVADEPETPAAPAEETQS